MVNEEGLTTVLEDYLRTPLRWPRYRLHLRLKSLLASPLVSQELVHWICYSTCSYSHLCKYSCSSDSCFVQSSCYYSFKSNRLTAASIPSPDPDPNDTESVSFIKIHASSFSDNDSNSSSRKKKKRSKYQSKSARQAASAAKVLEKLQRNVITIQTR